MTLNFIDVPRHSPKGNISETGWDPTLPVFLDAISGYRIVSFDIFETLLHREGVFRPIDLFLEVGRHAAPLLGVSDLEFAHLRMRAERDSRSSLVRRKGREVRSVEIYDRLNSLLPTIGRPVVARQDVLRLQEIECEVELAHLRELPSVTKLYRAAIADGKTVILVSDFYARQSFVESALEANNLVGHHELFVSSELDLTKHDGNLYKHVCRKLGASPSEILHLGDNAWSDGSRALQSGIAHLRINNPTNPMTARWRLDWRSPARPMASAISANQAAYLFGGPTNPTRPNDRDVLERVGRECLGPLLLGLSSWLYAEVRDRSLAVMHFCSRDGLVMKRAFDLFQKRHGRCVDTRYLKISRQVIYRAHLVIGSKAAASLFAQNWGRLTPREALSRWGVNPIALDRKVRASGFSSLDDTVAIGNASGTRQFEALFDACQGDLRAANAEHASLFHEYLVQERVTESDRALIVDVGWHGSLQKGLQEVLSNGGWGGRVGGRYLGLFLGEGGGGFDQLGYLFSRDGTSRAKALRASPSLVELLHTAGHGSTSGYLRTGTGTVDACFEDRPDELRQHADTIALIQTAALEFVEEILGNPRLGPDQLDPADAFRGLDRLLNRPDPDELNVLGELKIAANYGATATSTALRQRSPEGYQLWVPR